MHDIREGLSTESSAVIRQTGRDLNRNPRSSVAADIHRNVESTPIRLIVGLGNPGSAYSATKHNVGFWLVDAFAKREGIALSERIAEAITGIGQGEHPLRIVKPQTYMNNSGRSVAKIMSRFGVTPAEIVVVQDDVDLPCGALRIKNGGSAGGHRGVVSMINSIQSDQFLRLKIGVGREVGIDTADYVLSPFSSAALTQVRAAIEKGVDVLSLLVAGRMTEAMNRYHVRATPPSCPMIFI